MDNRLITANASAPAPIPQESGDRPEAESLESLIRKWTASGTL